MKKFEYARVEMVSLINDDILTASPSPMYDDENGMIGEFDTVKIQ